jgi:REP element-mobilizing transposase RayT
MPRPPRFEYAGAVYHVTSRGTQQGAIFLDDKDRVSLLTILTRALQACDAQLFAYCLMGNHYHLVLQTNRANLSLLMRRVNSLHSLAFNRRHVRRGPVFEGRFKALHVDRDSYLLAVCRYVDLNPVRAGLVDSAEQWLWSSHRAHVGLARSPSWLLTGDLHGALMGHAPVDTVQTEAACGRYAEWVNAGRAVWLWRDSLRDGFYLGDAEFVQSVRRMGGAEASD